jgi:hypothetical protein
MPTAFRSANRHGCGEDVADTPNCFNKAGIARVGFDLLAQPNHLSVNTPVMGSPFPSLDEVNQLIPVQHPGRNLSQFEWLGDVVSAPVSSPATRSINSPFPVNIMIGISERCRIWRARESPSSPGIIRSSRTTTSRASGAHVCSVCSVAHLEALFYEITPQQGPHAGLVIDDQDMERITHARSGIEPREGENEHVEPVRHISTPADIKRQGFRNQLVT